MKVHSRLKKNNIVIFFHFIMTCLQHDIVSKTINNLRLYSFSGDPVSGHDLIHTLLLWCIYKKSNFERLMLVLSAKRCIYKCNVLLLRSLSAHNNFCMNKNIANISEFSVINYLIVLKKIINKR